jgi:chemotaxis protein MotA
MDYPSMAIVVGGSIFATLIAFPLKQVLAVLGVAKKAFGDHGRDYQALIDQLVKFAEIARRDGILALEAQTEEVSDDFMVLGIQMAVDGTPAETIHDIMQSEIDTVANRHRIGKSLFDTLGRYAPAFGMIGTLIGLVIMLGNMDDPAAIGPGMAVALLTTLYGALMANVVCLPIADKLAYYSKQEILARNIILRGMMAIQSGDNPRVVMQKLQTFLPPAQRGEETKESA